MVSFDKFKNLNHVESRMDFPIINMVYLLKGIYVMDTNFSLYSDDEKPSFLSIFDSLMDQKPLEVYKFLNGLVNKLEYSIKNDDIYQTFLNDMNKSKLKLRNQLY